MLPPDLAGFRDHRDELAPALFGTEPRAAATAAAEERLARPELERVGLEEPPPLFARVEVEEPRARDGSWATSSCGRRPRRARSNRSRRASAPARDSAPGRPFVSISFAQVTFTNGFASRNSPVSRSST